jgi:hypothetical protein
VTGKSKQKVSVPSNILTVNVASTSRPPISGAVQQTSEVLHGLGHQSSSQPEVLVTTMDAHAVTMTTTAARIPMPPDIVIRQAGCWTRFWLFFCCMDSEDTANPH